MPRTRKSTITRIPKDGDGSPSWGRRQSPSSPLHVHPPVTRSWRETWRESGHRIALSLAGSAGAIVVVVLECWLRSY